MACEYKYTACTKEDLLKIIRETNMHQNKPPGIGAPPVPFFRTLANDYDEVYPGIIVGNQSVAKDKDKLQVLGITHIVNAAQGQRFGQVDTDDEFYDDLNVRFYGINAMDTANFKLSIFFMDVANFIHGARMQGGRVFVHCLMGVSRSATLVIAYLMLKWDQPVQIALHTMRQRRQVYPNDGFLEQLCVLNEELFKDKFTQVEDETMTHKDMEIKVKSTVSGGEGQTEKEHIS